MLVINNCSAIHFDGYIIEPRDIKEDPELEEEVETWIRNHPEYFIYHIEHNGPDSGGYEMSVDIYYKEEVHDSDCITTRRGNFMLESIKRTYTIILRRCEESTDETRRL